MSADKTAPAKLKARQPRGFVDRGPADVAATERMLSVIRESFSVYGFDPVETPFVEYTDALGKFLPDQDRPNEGVFSFQDDDEQWLSLRYDLTAPLARYVAENFDALPKPYRSYRVGYVFRNEKPGPGRFRQFMQFDADIVGSGTVAGDAEICMLAADTMEKLGIRRGDYVVKINHRGLLDGVLESIGVTQFEQKLTVLRAIDKHDKVGDDGVFDLLTIGRTDQSGDFTKGAGLHSGQAEALTRSLFGGALIVGWFADFSGDHGRPMSDMHKHGEGGTFYDNYSVTREIRSWPLANYEVRKACDEIDEIIALCESAGYGSTRIQFAPSVVRGLEYYTGPVYEVELTFPVTNEDGQVVRFGSVAGGGRYDGLVGRFRPEPVPATGFSIGVSRLFSALKAVKSPIVDSRNELPLVVVTAMDNKSPEFMPGYQAMVSALRQARDADGKPLARADLYLGSSGFNAQMKYADRRGAICAIIQGSSEREAGTVVIKDLILGAELAAASRDVKDSAEHKAKQAEAQFAVPVAELVEGVKRVLARHA
ncbi:HisS family protein [Bosea sp. ANAM02]|uniref:histidine--tRNA ligase n=1 Tax=Bosea sp. ANAM02 TaxID=2020412 RepID=UPI00140F3E3B|nr:HisS family protein [Bosea sp. ANAM02]BCB20684.1 histidine--tRNA ligase [Bosea sp. ANAM02]